MKKNTIKYSVQILADRIKGGRIMCDDVMKFLRSSKYQMFVAGCNLMLSCVTEGPIQIANVLCFAVMFSFGVFNPDCNWRDN